METSQNQPETNWDKFKKKLAAQGQARPWHLLNPEAHIPDDVVTTRLDICRGCDSFISKTNQCRECGCIMSLKARLGHAVCPLGKW